MGETITDQGELVGICGWNGTTWEPVLIDASKRLEIAVAVVALPTGAATSAKQLANDHDVNVSNQISGFATALKQLANDHDVNVSNASIAVTSGNDKLVGFESIVEGSISNLALAAGTNTLNGSAVPEGKIWKITSLSFMYSGTPPSKMLVFAIGLAGGLALKIVESVTNVLWYSWQGGIFLQEGDYIQLLIQAATLDDDAYIRYAGLQMDAP